MIVRDESQVIDRCLDSVIDLIGAWVVVDTGSTDDTPDRVTARLAHLPGALHHRPWRDFGTNRTELLELARGTADHLLLVDADMTVEVDGSLPPLTLDAYRVIQHNGGLSYATTALVSGDGRWWYEGVTHEVLTGPAGHRTGMLDVMRLRHHADGGARSDKLVRDRRLLERAFHEQPENPRTVFYLAQTYRDLGERHLAVKMYRRRVEMGGWDEEVFYAAFQVGVLLSDLDWMAGIPALLEAWERRPGRAEPLYELARRARLADQPDIAHMATSLAIGIPPPDDILFVHDDVYRWGVRFEHSVASAHVGDHETARVLTLALLAEPSVPGPHRRHLRDNLRWLEGQPRHDAPAPGAATAPRPRVPRPGQPLPRLDAFVDVDHRTIPRIGDTVLRETNPTVAVDGDAFRGIVRQVNYQLGSTATLDGADHLRTVNNLVRIDADLSVVEAERIDEAELPRDRAPIVRGFEDCRLFRWRGGWWATASTWELDDELCQVALLELDGSRWTTVSALEGPEPGRHEKNWMPFVRDGELHFVYACDPFTVLRYDGRQLNEVRRVRMDHRFARLRGSSQGVRIDDGFLFVVHEVDQHAGGRRYAHRFLAVGPELTPTGLSLPFAFVQDGVEFCAGLACQGEDLVMSFGVDDASAHLCRAPLSAVLDLVEPLLPQPSGRQRPMS